MHMLSPKSIHAETQSGRIVARSGLFVGFFFFALDTYPFFNLIIIDVHSKRQCQHRRRRRRRRRRHQRRFSSLISRWMDL